MAFHLAHAGDKLYKIASDGTALELGLPAGVTLSTTRRARFAILGRNVVMMHAPSRNLLIDPNLVVRLLTPSAPLSAPSVALGAAGSLTGTYHYRVSFVIMSGTVLYAESGLSDASAAIAPTADRVSLSNIPVSADPGVTGRRIYRTAADGEEYFLVTTIANNTATTYSDNQTDEEISILPVESDLGGSVPGSTDAIWFEGVVSWKDRLWAHSNDYPDRVHYSGNKRPFAFAEDAFLTAQPEGRDQEGVTGYAPRRDELGIGKRRQLWKVIGTDPDTFQMIQVQEGVGIWAPESVCVIRDEAYFLAEDGVYKWGPGGLMNLSRDKVHPWFTRDDTFNRALFSSAFAVWNQRTDAYELHLAAAGSTDIDRWISLDLKQLAAGNLVWLGPHKTAAFTPTCAAVLEDDDGLVAPHLGASSGKVYKQNSETFSDDGSAIDFDVTGKFHSWGDPDRTHYWGELSVHSRIEAGGTLTITPKVGRLDASAQPSITHDLTSGRQRLRRLGVGAMAQLRFQNAEVNQRVELYAYEVDPVNEMGRR